MTWSQFFSFPLQYFPKMITYLYRYTLFQGFVKQCRQYISGFSIFEFRVTWGAQKCNYRTFFFLYTRLYNIKVRFFFFCVFSNSIRMVSFLLQGSQSWPRLTEAITIIDSTTVNAIPWDDYGQVHSIYYTELKYNNTTYIRTENTKQPFQIVMQHYKYLVQVVNSYRFFSYVGEAEDYTICLI